MRKNLSVGKTCPASNRPIAFSNANKFLSETDYLSKFMRIYNSSRANQGIEFNSGLGWITSFSQRIIDNSTIAVAIRKDGKTIEFRKNSAWGYVSDADVLDQLSEVKDAFQTRVGWYLRDAVDLWTEAYDASGILQGVTRKDGTTQIVTYTDGTDGVTSGRGGFVLDASGAPNSALLPAGLLLRVTDDFGHSLTFGYDAVSHITRVSDGTNTVAYSYDAAGNLSMVTYPDGLSKTYLYGESAYIASGSSQPNALTGILDENGVRYASYWYDASGRAYDEKIAEGSLSNVDRSILSYALDGSGNVTSTAVTDALGATRTYRFTNLLGVNRLTGVDQPGGSGCGAASSAISYDANGNVASRTGFKEAGSPFDAPKSCHAYEMSRNLETVRLEGLSASTSCPTDLSAYSIPAPAAGTSVSVKKSTTAWHPNWRLETRRAEPKLITTSVYNGQVDPTNVGAGAVSCAPASATVTDVTGTAIPIAVLCRKIEQATSDETGTLGFGATPVGSARVTSYTYNAFGQILSEDGPRSDVNDITTYSYYPDTVFDGAGAGHSLGDLWKVTNAVGQVTENTSFDKAGRVLEVKDANGVLTQSTYWPRGWLKSQSIVTPGSATPQITTYDYDNVGQLKKVTQPDGSYTAYDYDAAHRLTDIRDNLANSIHYTLDAAGNRIGEVVKDTAGSLKRATTRIFDQLGRLQNVVVQ